MGFPGRRSASIRAADSGTACRGSARSRRQSSRPTPAAETASSNVSTGCAASEEATPADCAPNGSVWLAPFDWEQRAFMYAIGSSHWALKNRLQGWLSLPSSPNSAAYAATKGALDPQWNTRLDDASPRRSIVHLAGGPRAKATKPAMMRALLRLGATNAGVVHRFTPGTVATRGIVAEARGAWAGQGFRLDEVTDRSVALGQVGRLAHGVCGLPPQVGRRYLRAYTHPNTSFVQRADMWRYARLLTQGGVYADGDASPTPAFLGEYARHISEGGEGLLFWETPISGEWRYPWVKIGALTGISQYARIPEMAQFVMASGRPCAPWLKALVELVADRVSRFHATGGFERRSMHSSQDRSVVYHTLVTTGPGALTDAARNHPAAFANVTRLPLSVLWRTVRHASMHSWHPGLSYAPGAPAPTPAAEGEPPRAAPAPTRKDRKDRKDPKDHPSHHLHPHHFVVAKDHPHHHHNRHLRENHKNDLHAERMTQQYPDRGRRSKAKGGGAPRHLLFV
mmetsp:Transcript_28524/g.85236  ORF Transcript_28524/g.85236 Transcript_28524/m.85236 type:complete len:511 (-) Transcript_28524:37-1569(-)